MPMVVDERRRTIGSTIQRIRQLDRSSLREDPATIVKLGVLLAACLASVWAIQTYGRYYTFLDLSVYHGAALWWTSGGDLYQYVVPGTTMSFTYPPFAALVMLPMVAVSLPVAGWINVVAGLAALTFILATLLNPIADRHGWPRWFVVGLAVPLAAATEPVRETLGFGQVNLLLAAFVIADLVALRLRGRSAIARAAVGRAGTGTESVLAAPMDLLRRAWMSGAFAGVGVGLATAVKLTPGLFILYFLITRQWRVAITAACTAFGATVFAFAFAGKESAAYFGSVMWDTSRVGFADATPNQSLAGLLARLYDSPTKPGLMWLAFAMLLLTVGLSRASHAHADGDEMSAFVLIALTANAICPISWTHHMVFMIPALVILVDSALRRRRSVRGFNVGGFPLLAGLRHAGLALGIYLLLVISPLWRYEHKLPAVSHYADGLTGALGENSMALALIVLIVLMPWRPGAEPAFYPDPALSRGRAGRAARAAMVRQPPVKGS
jgi:alpha-1,2-mannosyltransferase